jgi:hypothetical protein
MRGLPVAETRPTGRTRRWDAVILGGAVPGLVAAVRLGMRGLRVLLLEEEASVRRFPGLREPFWTTGAQRESVLGACLRELRVPLIDQRRIERDPLAFQVVLPDARLDVGDPRLTLDEWVAWGLAKPEEARPLVAALDAAATAERRAMLEAPFVRTPRLLARPELPAAAAGAPPARRARGVPGALDAAPPRLARILEAQVRALSRHGSVDPSPEARARLLGAPLEGGVCARGEVSLREILRRRVESLYGELRTLPSQFRLVSWGGQPGIAPDRAGESGEVWVGRAFVLNAPRDALAAAVAQEPLPELLRAPPARQRELSVHLRVERDAVPEAMAGRVVVLRDPEREARGTNVVRVRRFATPERARSTDLVATAVVATDALVPEAAEDELVQAVADLMPFAEGRFERVPEPQPRWDDDGRLPDPAPGHGWPAEAELRLPTRQPVYLLDRAAVAALGFEGDLLLGWRAGDAIAADLA